MYQNVGVIINICENKEKIEKFMLYKQNNTIIFVYIKEIKCRDKADYRDYTPTNWYI